MAQMEPKEGKTMQGQGQNQEQMAQVEDDGQASGIGDSNPIFDAIRSIGMLAAALQEQGDPRASGVAAAVEGLISALKGGGQETGNPEAQGVPKRTQPMPMAKGAPSQGIAMGGGMGRGVPAGGGGMPAGGRGVPVM